MAHQHAAVACVFFIFAFFKKKLQKYIFGFRFYSYIPLPPGRGRQGAYRPAGGGGGRDLYINKNNFFCAEVFGGSLPPHQLAAGGRQAPTTNIKLRPFPLRPHFLPTRSREGRGRVSEVIPPAEPCQILDPNRR